MVWDTLGHFLKKSWWDSGTGGLFVGHFGFGRCVGADAGDFGLNVGELFVDEIFTGEKCVVCHLKNRKRRRDEAFHTLARFEIDPSCVQPPKRPEMNVERKRQAVKLVKVAIFADFPALELLKDGIFGFVEIHLGDLVHGVFAIDRRKTLLQNVRPGVGVRIADRAQPYACVFDVIVEKLKVTAGSR